MIKLLLFQECVGRVCDLTGCQASDVKVTVLEQQKQQQQQQICPETPPLSSEPPAPGAVEAVDGKVVKGYSGLVSVVAAVGVALLAVAVWLVYSMQ